jgi:hypothetical protein
MESLEDMIAAHTQTLEELRRTRSQIARELKRRASGKGDERDLKPYGIPGMEAYLERVEGEIEAQEELLDLLRNPGWVDLLGGLLADPEQVHAAAADPSEYARERGVEIPAMVDVAVTRMAARPDVTVTGYDPRAPFQLRWTSDGFQRAAPPSAPDEARRTPGRGRRARRDE